MRLTLVLSLAVLATCITGLPFLSTSVVETRHDHDHEHDGFKRFKRVPHDLVAVKRFNPVTDGEDTMVVKARRSAAIDFPDGGDSDGGVDNLPKPKIERSPVIDFPDGGDSDGGVDNLPPPPTKIYETKIYKRNPTIDFPDGGDSDGGVDNLPPPKEFIERSPVIDFPDGGDSDGGVDNIKPPPKLPEKFKRSPLLAEDADADYADGQEDYDAPEDEDYGDVEVKKIKRHYPPDFPDGGDTDGGTDDVVKKVKRHYPPDFPDGGDTDGGTDDVVKKVKRHYPPDFPDGGDTDGGTDDVVKLKKSKRNRFF